MGVDAFDGVHAVDIRAAQHEHLVHAAVRGDAGELRLHVFEQRAGGLGAQVLHAQAEVAEAARLDDLHLGVGVRQHVLARLAEKLERQRDVLAVDVMHLRGVGDVGRAVGRAGRDHGRHGAVEAGADRVEGEFHGAITSGARASTVPACGPGVWSKTISGAKRSAARSPVDRIAASASGTASP